MAAGEIFVDTSAWYPIVMRSHPDHQELAETIRALVAVGRRIVTTNLVTAETHALLLRRDRRETALEFVRSIREPPNLVVSVMPELEDLAVREWLEPYTDHDFSFTDATSFAVMKERGIEEALTLDRHFAVAGFRMAPAPPAP